MNEYDIKRLAPQWRRFIRKASELRELAHKHN